MSAPLIAVVDDDDILVALLEEFLTGEGYRVETERVASRAVAFVARVRPAFVILDLWMQGAEDAGVRVLRQLRGTPATAAVPVIVCSAAAHVVAAYGDELRLAGCAILDKPFHLDELLACIAQVLSECGGIRPPPLDPPLSASYTDAHTG